MLDVIWMALFFFMTGSVQTDRSHTTGAVPKSRKNYPDGWSITFSGGLITSEAGLCTIIQCSFTHNATFKPTSAIWFKQKYKIHNIILHSEDVMKAQVPFRGRVALLEPNITQKNCSITINDLTESDNGSYGFRVIGQRNGQIDGYTFELKKHLSVTGLSRRPKVKLPPALTEGQQTTLTCTAPGLCSGTPPNITWTWGKTGHFDPDVSLIQSNATIFKTESLTGVSQRHSSAFTFTPSSEHDGSEVTCQVTFKGNIKAVETVTLNVTYLKMPIIKGNTTVEEGGTLNLTCDAENSPPSIITWTELDSNKKRINGTERASLVIPMVTREHSGRYSCTAQHLNKTLTTFTDITVMTFPTILNGSECVLQLRTLICVCISEGFPLPTIRWPLLKNRSVYSVLTAVLNSTVNSTFYLTVKDHYNTSVKCLSKNNVKTVDKTLLIIEKDEPKHKVGQNEGFFSTMTEVKTVIAFLIGVTLPITICCLAGAFHRCREKNSGCQYETVQMVTHQNQQTGGGQGADGDEQTPHGEALEGGGDAERDQNSQGEVKEVEYASIDYSQLKRRNPEEADHGQQTIETEYAEVKREERNRDQYSGMLKREDEEEEAMMVECEDSKTEEEDREDTALYSNVKAIMDEG